MTLEDAVKAIASYSEYDEEKGCTVTLNVEEFIAEADDYFIFLCSFVENGSRTDETGEFGVFKSEGYVLPVPV